MKTISLEVLAEQIDLQKLLLIADRIEEKDEKNPEERGTRFEKFDTLNHLVETLAREVRGADSPFPVRNSDALALYFTAKAREEATMPYEDSLGFIGDEGEDTCHLDAYTILKTYIENYVFR